MSSSNPSEFLIYGASGYLGSHIVTALQAQGKTVVIGNARIENKSLIEAEIDSIRPKYVICAAGLAGKPNVVRYLTFVLIIYFFWMYLTLHSIVTFI